MGSKKMKLVSLLNPEMCADCRFAKTCQIELQNGNKQMVTHCYRGDCDNWDLTNAEDIKLDSN